MGWRLLLGAIGISAAIGVVITAAVGLYLVSLVTAYNSFGWFGSAVVMAIFLALCFAPMVLGLLKQKGAR